MGLVTYSIGEPKRPRIRHDNGFLDRFSKRAPDWSDRAAFAYWVTKLEAAEAAQGLPGAPYLPDALAAYRHFLSGNGKSRIFSYERFVANDSAGRTILNSMIEDAKAGAEDLYAKNFSGQASVKFKMTSTHATTRFGSKKLPYPATENWQKAIGGHNVWVSANVEVTTSSAGGRSFKMLFTLHAEDRYNFNPDSADIATGIPDDANGRFSITGLAHQYMHFSTLRREAAWKGGSATGAIDVNGEPRFRQRQPQDNRRARNRL